IASTTRSRVLSIAVALCGSSWIFHDIARGEVSPSHAARILVSADVVRERLPRPALAGPPLPRADRCRQNPERCGIKFNGSGWASTGDCSVDPGSMFFLPTAECLRVTVAPIAGASLTPAETDVIRAKIGLTELRRIGAEPADDGVRLTFCAPAGRTPNPQ